MTIIVRGILLTWPTCETEKHLIDTHPTTKELVITNTMIHDLLVEKTADVDAPATTVNTSPELKEITSPSPVTTTPQHYAQPGSSLQDAAQSDQSLMTQGPLLPAP
jgi:predicted methyltransferase